MNIFISNLSFQVKDEDLKQIFDEYGEVSSAKVITDKLTGRSRGFGFVEMNREEEAKAAIEALNDADFDGKVITVSEARPRPEGDRRPSGGGGGSRGGYGGGRSNGGGGYGGGNSGGGGGGNSDRGYRNRY